MVYGAGTNKLDRFNRTFAWFCAQRVHGTWEAQKDNNHVSKSPEDQDQESPCRQLQASRFRPWLDDTTTGSATSMVSKLRIHLMRPIEKLHCKE